MLIPFIMLYPDPIPTLILICFFCQDLLMVIYLTQLTKTQLQLHEKLTSVSVNQLKEYQKLIPENTN